MGQERGRESKFRKRERGRRRNRGTEKIERNYEIEGDLDGTGFAIFCLFVKELENSNAKTESK